MKIIKYLILFGLLSLGHLWLSSWLLIAFWLLTGVVLALMPNGIRLLHVLLLEAGVSLLFLLFAWNRTGQLDQLAHRVGTSGIALMGIVAGINILTSFLCITTFYTIVRKSLLFFRYR